MKKVLVLLAIVMFGVTFAMETPVAYDYYDYYGYDDYDYGYYDYGHDDSMCCCTGFILPLGALLVGVGYTRYKK